jgi:hypothetical protein
MRKRDFLGLLVGGVIESIALALLKKRRKE